MAETSRSAHSSGTANKLAVLFGGSGFIGRYAVRSLASGGWRIRAAERRPDLAGHLQPMGAVGQIHAIQANLRYDESVRRAVEGADAVVNLVAVLAESGRQTFQALHVDGARRAAKAAKAAGARTFVHISAIGADVDSRSNYGRSKGEGEAAVLAEFPGAIILRPSIVFGPEDAFFNRFAGLARMAPVLPLIGGQSRFQPVYVGDVAEAIAAALNGKAKPGAIYELGGPEVLTFQTLLERTMTYAEQQRPLLPIPFGLAKLGAALSKPLPLSLRPMTVDQVRLLQQDNIVTPAAHHENRTLAGLGIAAPRAVESIVPAYLTRYRPKGQFATYRG
jgi:uncharacterized protein YbjT (DUF2867 family)